MIKLECIKTIATGNNRNDFSKGKIYEIDSEDEQVLFFINGHKEQRFFIKPHIFYKLQHLDCYSGYRNVEDYFLPSPVNKRFVIIEKIGRQFNFKNK